MYSYFFAFNAIGALIGPMLFIRLSRRMSSGNIMATAFILLVICGALPDIAGNSSPYAFALLMAAATVAVGMLRPPTANLLLSQQEVDTGSAASLINLTGMLMGSVGMFLISLETGNTIRNMGVMQVVVGAVCACFWFLIRGKSFIQQPE